MFLVRAIVAAELQSTYQLGQCTEVERRDRIMETAMSLLTYGNVRFSGARENLRSEDLDVYELSVPIQSRIFWFERVIRQKLYLIITPEAFIFCEEFDKRDINSIVANLPGVLTFNEVLSKGRLSCDFLINILVKFVDFREYCVARRRIICGLGVLAASICLAGVSITCDDSGTPAPISPASSPGPELTPTLELALPTYGEVGIRNMQDVYDYIRTYSSEGTTDALDDPGLFTRKVSSIIVSQGSRVTLFFDKYPESQCRFFIPIINIDRQNDGKVRVIMMINESEGSAGKTINIIRGEGEKITAEVFTHSELEGVQFLLFCWYYESQIHLAVFYLEGEGPFGV